MKKAGVPVIPGSEGAVRSVEEAMEAAKSIGFPLLVKASAGGGGRGIRMVESEDQLASQIEIARQEAKNFFGYDAVYMERFVKNPRHVEIQILADKQGMLFIWANVTVVCKGVIKKFWRKAQAL